MYTTRGAMLVISTRQIFVVNNKKIFWLVLQVLFHFLWIAVKKSAKYNGPHKMWFIGFAHRLQRMCFCTMHLARKSNSLFANRVWQASNTYASCQICHMCNAFIYMTPAAMDKNMSQPRDEVRSDGATKKNVAAEPSTCNWHRKRKKNKGGGLRPPLKHFFVCFLRQSR